MIYLQKSHLTLIFSRGHRCHHFSLWLLQMCIGASINSGLGHLQETGNTLEYLASRSDMPRYYFLKVPIVFFILRCPDSIFFHLDGKWWNFREVSHGLPFTCRSIWGPFPAAQVWGNIFSSRLCKYVILDDILHNFLWIFKAILTVIVTSLHTKCANKLYCLF